MTSPRSPLYAALGPYKRVRGDENAATFNERRFPQADLWGASQKVTCPITGVHRAVPDSGAARLRGV